MGWPGPGLWSYQACRSIPELLWQQHSDLGGRRSGPARGGQGTMSALGLRLCAQ